MNAKIEIPQAEIAAFSRRHRIRRLSLFGSVLRDDFTPESDVDVLVEFEPGSRIGLRFFALTVQKGTMASPGHINQGTATILS